MDEKIDKTKEKIGVSNLHENDRKKLFNKFVDAGGKVIDEKAKNKNLSIDRDKQRLLKKKVELQKEKLKKSSQNETATQRIQKTSVKSSQSNGLIAGFFKRLQIKLKLTFMGVIRFNGIYFNIKFLQKFNNDYKPALMELQMIYFDIFKNDPPTGRKVIEALDKARPIYYEVIEMMGKIYDDITMKQVVEHYLSFPDVPKNISELKDPLMNIFKKLYVLKLYENTILNSFDKALNIRLKIDKDKTSAYSQQRKKVKNNLYEIFHRLYPRLHRLFCFYEGKLYEENDSFIEKILSIKSEEKPGTRVFFGKKEEPADPEFEDNEISEDKSEQEDNKSENDGLGDSVKSGLDIIYKLDYKKMRSEYDKSEQFKYIPLKDKVLITYLLFSEFDKEYSCILTTSKIKYKKEYDLKGLKDFKAITQSFYDQMRKCFDSFKDYTGISADYFKASSDKPVSNSQFFQYSKRITEIHKKRTQNAMNTRSLIRTFMEKLSEELKILIDDMTTQKKFVDNPEEILEFSAQIEGDKKINGKSIIDGINTVYSFTAAFAYRLGFGGDLSGDLEFQDDEMLNKPQNNNQPDIMDKKAARKESPKEEKSILDELDDVL